MFKRYWNALNQKHRVRKWSIYQRESWGLKFTPIPKTDSVDLKKDTEEFCRKLRLREFFQSEINEDESLVRNKKRILTSFENIQGNTLPVLMNQQIPIWQDLMWHQTFQEENSKLLKNLSEDSSIIIKEADKGGAIIIMENLVKTKTRIHYLKSKS